VRAPTTLDPAAFREALAEWYRLNARRLPWRGIHDAYATWLSEIMLQQTRVATVIDRYTEFLRCFPTLIALAAAAEADVLALWSGLGYYRRARMLHRAAQFIVSELHGEFPRSSAELQTLPGVGDYTAAAVASIAFGEHIAAVDGNVERVLLRVLGRAEDRTASGLAVLNATAQSLLPPAPRQAAASRSSAHDNPAGDHNQAMMELGATICLPRQPLCLQCPVMAQCRTRGEHSTATRGKMRSREVAHLVALRKKGTGTEVLLERRAATASLMPGMLELPPLPLDAVTGREPALRLRHAITNTNYAVSIFTEEQSPAASGKARRTQPAQAISAAAAEPAAPSLIEQIPAARRMLHWTAVQRLPALPLTGLTRKTLQRLGMMSVLGRA
jgi:A/G-specific adenine glycosylase